MDVSSIGILKEVLQVSGTGIYGTQELFDNAHRLFLG